jgi:hypothetical protein
MKYSGQQPPKDQDPMKGYYIRETGMLVAAIASVVSVFLFCKVNLLPSYSPEYGTYSFAVAVGAGALVFNIHSWRIFTDIIIIGSLAEDKSNVARLLSLIALKSLFILLIVGGLMLVGAKYLLPALVGYGLPLVVGLFIGMVGRAID